MKYVPFTLLLFLSLSGFSQQTVYQVFEVDSAAQPVGGAPAFNTFLQANLRKPIPAQSIGIGGIIVVSGVVEPDGHVSEIKVTKSLRPDCDKEAVRVFRLFKAWKPAKKQGLAVRQQISMPIVFKPNAQFRYEQGKQITFFDTDTKLLPDSNERVKFKQITPLDTNGLPTGDLVIYKLINQQWEEYARDSLARKLSDQTDLSGQPIYYLGYQLSLQKLKGYLYTVTTTGQVLTESFYEAGKLAGTQFLYHANGVLAEKREHFTDKLVIVCWYHNGQIKQIQETINEARPVGFHPIDPANTDKVTTFWDSTGRQLVTAGNGQIISQKLVRSFRDKAKVTSLIEQGSYKNYLKQGVWKGIYSDSSFFYEEQYDKGLLTAGKSWTIGQDTSDYILEDRPPAFPGGLTGLSTFLAENLQYPIGAQKARASGQVVVSFVVCEDGTLCDYEVKQRVHPEIDREAIRVVKKMSGRWIPGVQGGKTVRVKYNMPVNFTLN